ncbi:MAG: FHA domain-containing protein [Planctomycetes bacterium RBG_16_64_10]|nr:MAG: FHA domain-containing protein [Planctomycetes bacterium RBG_16_64_10]
MTVVTLRLLDGADRGHVYEDLPTPVTIGREEGNTIQLNDERVSRYHVKIQDDQENVVLTDLESTNGTKVNGEEIQLRILRHGDVINIGRTLLLYGKREQIAERLAALRRQQGALANADEAPPMAVHESSLDFEFRLGEACDLQSTLHIPILPDLPQRLSPAQAAQLSELLEYVHIRIRGLIGSVKIKPSTEQVTLEIRQWQNLLDLQSRLAEMLRSIGEPDDRRS